MMRIHELSSRQCAFALLDAPQGRGRDAQRELLYQFEALLPQSIDGLQVAFSKPIEGKVVACACDRTLIESLRNSVDILIPDSIPVWLGESYTNLQRNQLNLLTGLMRPVSAVQRERLNAKLVCFASLVIMLLLVLGVSRRLHKIELQRDTVNSQIATIYSQVLPRTVGAQSQPDSVRFSSMLNQARATRTGTGTQSQHDLVFELSAIFTQWPTTIPFQVRSLVIGDDSLRMEVSVENNELATQVIQAISQLHGWEISTRTTTPRADQVDLSVTLSRSSSAEEAS